MVTQNTPHALEGVNSWRTAIPGMRVVGAVLLALLFVAVLYDQKISVVLQSWPLEDRQLFGWLSRWGESDWILVPTLLMWIVAYLVALFPVGYTNRHALRAISGMGGYIFICVGVLGLAANLFKRLIGRARPVHLEVQGVLSFRPFSAWDQQSFPSGHATTSVALAVALFVLFGRRALWFAPVVLLICLSRIVVGMHFFTDVIGGVCLGYFGAWFITRFFARRGWGITIKGQCLRVRFGDPLRRWHLGFLRRRASASMMQWPLTSARQERV